MNKDVVTLLGRILIALLFVPGGFGKIAGFAGTAGYIASKGLPLPEVGAAIAVLVELGVGLMLLVGWKTRWASLILAAFTVVTAVIFHNFWSVPAEQMMSVQVHFFKNMAITGGLLFVWAYGPGRLSVDRA